MDKILLLLLYLTCQLAWVCLGIKWTRVVNMDNKIINTPGQEYWCSKLQCAVQCSKYIHCYSFSYDVIASRCVLYHDVISSGISNDGANRTKTVYYISSERQKNLPPCTNKYRQDSGLCFKIYDKESLDLAEARMFCERDNAGLVILDSHQKSHIIHSYLQTDTLYRIGLVSAGLDSTTYKWDDGQTTVNYTNWAVGEPPYFSFSHVRWCVTIEYMISENDFKWVTYDCQHRQSFICQISPFDKNT